MGTDLRKGSSGREVRALQHALNARPYLNLDETGVFDLRTETAVREFQRRVHLPDDGIVGSKTHSLLWTRAVFANAILQVPVANASGDTPDSTSAVRNVPNPGKAAPSARPAPASSSGLIHQVSAGGQISFTPWLTSPAPMHGTPSGSIWSGQVSYALVYRTASEGRHVEFSLNPGFLVNSRVQSTDPRFSLQVNGQVTFADLVAPGRWHLISPYLQGGAVLNVGPGPYFGAGVAIGNQVSFDLIRDRLQINLQSNLAAQWNNIGKPSATFSVLGQVALGTTIQF